MISANYYYLPLVVNILYNANVVYCTCWLGYKLDFSLSFWIIVDSYGIKAKVMSLRPNFVLYSQFQLILHLLGLHQPIKGEFAQPI